MSIAERPICSRSRSRVPPPGLMFGMRWDSAVGEMRLLRRWTTIRGATWTAWVPISYWCFAE